MVDVLLMLNGEKMSIKMESGISTVEKESSSFDIADSVAVVKVENEVAAEDETEPTGNSVDFFENETKGIKTESVDINSTENPSEKDSRLSHPSSSCAVESNMFIKKEKNIDANDEVFQGTVESRHRPSPGDEKNLKSDGATTLYDQVNESSPWGLCEEDSGVSRSGHAESHLRIHKNEALFLCMHCPAKFSHSSHLKNHVTTHTGEKPFYCTYCPAKFSRNSHLKTHLRTHTNEKPFLCTYCPAKFSRIDALRTHLRIHTCEKPYPCSHCPAKFCDGSNLRIHLRTHTKEKPFACTYCPSKFSQSNTLIKHLRVHTKERPYLCSLCPAKFTQGSTLKRHTLRHHTAENKK